MARTTSYTLGDELDGYIQKQVADGRYGSASEVVREALERHAEETRKEAWALAAIDEGLASGPATEGAFDRVLGQLDELERLSAGGKR